MTSLGLFKNSKGVVTQWLSNDSREYCFSESQRCKHSPKALADYPGISKLLNLVNADPRTTQNLDAALISAYNSKNTALNFHNDGEHIIDQNSSIATISLGSTRSMEFCPGGRGPQEAGHSFEVHNHDMVIMKPGCQQIIKHRICSDESDDIKEVEWRVSISFRKVTPLDPIKDVDPEISFDVNETK